MALETAFMAIAPVVRWWWEHFRDAHLALIAALDERQTEQSQDLAARAARDESSTRAHNIYTWAYNHLPSALAPRCTRWKSSTTPPRAEYIAMGETATRFGSVRPRRRNGTANGGRPSSTGGSL